MFIFQAIRPGLHHFSHPNAQILPPIKIGREAVLDVWVLPNKDGDGPRKYTLRRLQAAHRRHRSKGQILRGVQLMECLPVGMFIG